MSYKYLVILFFTLNFFVHSFHAQIGVGDWRMHISPNDGIGVVQSEEYVHLALSRGLLSYDLQSGEKTIRTAANFLSDVNLTAIGYHAPSDGVFIGYSNGNLDMLFGERIVNLPAIPQSSVSGVRRINSIKALDGEMYLATGFGIVVIQVDRREVKDTYFPSSGTEPIVDVAFSNDSIYALTRNKLYVASLSNNFLADPSQWKESNMLPNYENTGSYNSIVYQYEALFVGYNDEIYSGDTIFKIENGQREVFLESIEIHKIVEQEEKLMICMDGDLRIYNSELELSLNIFQYQHDGFPGPNDAVYVDGNYFIADRRSGLVKAANAFNSQHISFEGPENSASFRVDWKNGKLAVAGGRLLGNNPSFSSDGGFTKKEETWESINRFNQDLLADKNIWDFISVAVNPRNTEEVAFGTYSEIPLIISKENATVTDTFSFNNSLIEAASTGNGWGYVGDVVYDSDGNLWVLNSLAERPLKVLTPEGIWYDYNLGSQVRNRYCRRLIIDNNGVKWFTVDGVGIAAFDDNGTIDDISDDRFRVLGTEQSNGLLPSSRVEALAVDFDNNIWAGTTEGFRVLYNTRNVFDGQPGTFNFQQLVIEFGENFEIVLGFTHITALAVDGANRKWIGTANSGVFLFSPDGLTLIRNFTAENSPLLSNAIFDIAIDNNNGEVYFVTDDGLISYRSDATAGSSSYQNVKVFPNPVLPNYFGPITIQGIAFNSDVRITDISGKLVYQTRSNGGTATWDGNSVTGERVATGVYLIWTTIDSETQKGRKVGKVVFIN